METVTIEKVLGRTGRHRTDINDKISLVKMSENGISKKALVSLSAYLNITIHRIAGFLPVTERTITRYKSSQVFNRFVSEHIIMMAEVVARGIEVFENREKFLTWLNLPHRSFGRNTPLEMLGSKYGVELVLDELVRIDHGVVS